MSRTRQRREKGTLPICRNGPKGASHKWGVSPFPSPATVLLLLSLILLAAAIISLDLGSTELSPGQILAALAGQGEARHELVILQLRLPRLVLSILIGVGLAVSGVILQGITRNDLASPDTVGVNAGAGLGMMFLLVMYPTAATQSPLLVPLGAVAGAMAMTALVFALAYRQGSVLPSRLLLVGIAVGFGARPPCCCSPCA